MSFNAIFDIASSGLSAETARLSTTASNMTNANMVSGSAADVYKPQYPVFKTIQAEATQWIDQQVKTGGVQVSGIYESDTIPISRYEPNNPMADKDGLVYTPNVNYSEEMANMISASRSYQMDVDMLDTVKKLMQRTLQLGQ